MLGPFTPITVAVPDLQALVETVMADATHPHSELHGPQHWQAVARVGAELIADGAAANPAVVFCFALLHDSQRLDDGEDPQHGPRAAAYIPTIEPDLLALKPAERQQLIDACRIHTSARGSEDPTIAVCLDADRLNLWRVGKWPDPDYLSTELAKAPGRMERCAQRVFEGTDWAELYDSYRRVEKNYWIES